MRANFKQDLVRPCKAKDKGVVYIGDGAGDYEAAKEAEVFFAIKDSRLARVVQQKRGALQEN